ncbi:hemerythrin domain-containing protein [Duganella sp. LX20W]|uniref:Hemerythrin domain-containing protein n=1 Tax=Rugamonas brunnea TaxID=2758569 RepID=A0A7W2IC10_9BURK|nr:hemerythrin domain-containing protein [Rugamonas brunnea]MBA5637874.1 hemerythrin domain-containing protein [Rugamonas brunnea]
MYTTQPPRENVIRIIQQEHTNLTAVIHNMQQFVRTLGQGNAPADLKIMRAMLLYVIDYPERVHHPKEDEHLFARLRQRTHDVDSTLDELSRQHVRGTTLTRELEHALARYEFQGAPALPALRLLVEEYGRFFFEHMRLEEDVVLPAALHHLTEADWIVIDLAFSANGDPLTGAPIQNNFSRLYQLIVHGLPGQH